MVRTVNSQETLKEDNRLFVKSAPDIIYLVLVLILIALGTVMLWSAGSDYMEGQPYYYLKQHAFHLIPGFTVAAICIFGISPRLCKIGGIVLYIITLLLLGAVLVLGITRGGAQRWIDLGFISFQPSELAKTSLILILAMYYSVEPRRFAISRHGFWRSVGRSFVYGVLIPGAIILSFCIPVILEKHLSGTVIIAAIGLVMMFLGGTSWFWLLFGIGGCGPLLVLFAWKTDYTRQRIEGLLNRGADPDLDWQTNEGLYAMGTGGFFGVGLGNSRLKYGYVSQPQNDFIFSVISEELGFFGSTLIMLLFLATAARGFSLAQHCKDRFSALVIAGLSFKLIIHVILNIGVTAAVLPNTGISLPFFSSGGTATLVQVFDAGIILGLSRYCND